jgi:magnesium chelatase family protein
MYLASVRGQEHAKRALEVAAAGFHNLIFNGPPGSGKTLLARCLPSILPRMTQQEALEVPKIYSVNGALPADNPLVLQRPFRSPHYTISNAGLVGGGRTLRPGEITMSHRGVLFLDELPEFNHTALESLRQPLEDKVVTISRVSGSVTYPASFMLVAAMNPCPCGYFTHPTKECTCSPSTVARYQKRISGPLLDRVDVFVEVPPVEYEKLIDDQPTEDSSLPRLRVEVARDVQRERFKESGFFCNSEMGPAEVWKFCQLDDGAKGLLQTATQRLNLSARAFHRILKVSRTIADLEGTEGINTAHLAEALQYRPRTAAS